MAEQSNYGDANMILGIISKNAFAAGFYECAFECLVGIVRSKISDDDIEDYIKMTDDKRKEMIL